jgi:multidrug efflux pump subunit AcrB
LKPEAPGATPPFFTRVVDIFLKGKLSPLLIALSLLAGAVSLGITPREEEPQIVVPMADVLVTAPGLSSEEIERHISTRLEKLLLQIDGVEHVYSMSRPEEAVITVRFYVGEDREDSLIKLHNKIESHRDWVPNSVTSWVVKPIEIDDVPIVIATLWSDRPTEIDDYALRRIAEELEIELQSVPQTNRTAITGGRKRTVRVELEPETLAARQTTPLDVAWALAVSNVQSRAGEFDRRDTTIPVDGGEHLQDIPSLERLTVNVVNGSPVFLKDIANVVDGPAERSSYTWFAFGPASLRTSAHESYMAPGSLTPAVHISIAKQKGSNAVSVANLIEERIAQLERTHLPHGVHLRITRNYGETANEKVAELVEALAVAIIIVIGLIAIAMGWREALVVAISVPITFSLVLFFNWLAGYTINRVTLFALILSLGLVVDDPIVDVENIHRHLSKKTEPPLRAVRTAVNEVRPPILLATAAVIVSFLPMLFITDMMGPYMRPMAINVPVAMASSMLVAFTITPWLSYHVMRSKASPIQKADNTNKPIDDSGLRRGYTRILEPFLENRGKALLLLATTAFLFFAALLLAGLRLVPLKMLPFDNKDEFQVVLDAPEGTTLERTDAIARRMALEIARASEVRDLSIFSGIASPMDFNGLVRHYFLREGPEVADIRVNLAEKRSRMKGSHDILLRLRPRLEVIAREEGVRIALVETPPGPPVLSTIVAEVYGSPQTRYEQIRDATLRVGSRLSREPLVSDVDTSVESAHDRLLFVVDKEKAALSGISTDDVTQTLRIALRGLDAAQLHVRGEVNPLLIRLQLPRKWRSGEEHLSALTLKGRPGVAKIRQGGGVHDAPLPLVRLGELGRFQRVEAERVIYHKNLQRVSYVYAEPVGRSPAEAIIDVGADRIRVDQTVSTRDNGPIPLEARTYFRNGGGDFWSLPDDITVQWNGEGEWKITLDVFRDLGIAFGVALLGIYLLLLYQTSSYLMPLVLMISIPLTLIGIMPGFWILNLLAGGGAEGIPTPVYFTATAMIGMIALAGISVRNSILLIEFLHVDLARGRSLVDSLISAGSMRTRAILLTAGTAVLAAVPITLDPIFSGLAWALIFGLAVSTAFTLVVVPIAYYLIYAGRDGHGLEREAHREEDIA